jgi:ATP synthase F1 gamma subunit
VSIKQVEEDLENGKSLKAVTEAFTDIASNKLRKIRTNIEVNRQFVSEIANLYQVIRTEALKRKVSLKTRPKPVVSILLTTNLRFYGAINANICQAFINITSQYQTDCIVVGQQGQIYLTSLNYPHPIKSFNFKDDLPDYDELVILMKEILQYEKILVYYCRLETVIVQVPTVIDISEQSSLAKKNALAAGTIDYIFEPEIKKLLDFFDGQILRALLEQAFLESELARTASRLISMDTAQMSAEKYVKDKTKELYRAKSRTRETRMLDAINSILSLRNNV